MVRKSAEYAIVAIKQDTGKFTVLDSNGLRMPHLESAHNLRKVKRFTQITQTSSNFHWAKVFFSPHRGIARLEAVHDPYEMACAILRRPEWAVALIEQDLDRHIAQLPPEWTLEKASTKMLVKRVHEVMGDLQGIALQWSDSMTADQVLLLNGMDSLALYYATVVLLQAKSVANQSKAPNQEKAYELATECHQLFHHMIQLWIIDDMIDTGRNISKHALQIVTLLAKLSDQLNTRHSFKISE